MITRPILATGILTLHEGKWQVALSSDDPAFEDSMPVRLVLWDERDGSEKSEVERIAMTQQLDPAIVALALNSEGAFSR